MSVDEPLLRATVSRGDIPEAVQYLDRAGPGDDAPTVFVAELVQHHSVALRKAAVAALGRIGDPASVAAIVRATDARNEKDRNVRRAAVGALRSFEGPEVERALRAATCDSALNVRADAEKALKGLQSGRER